KTVEELKAPNGNGGRKGPGWQEAEGPEARERREDRDQSENPNQPDQRAASTGGTSQVCVEGECAQLERGKRGNCQEGRQSPFEAIGAEGKLAAVAGVGQRVG